MAQDDGDTHAGINLTALLGNSFLGSIRLTLGL